MWINRFFCWRVCLSTGLALSLNMGFAWANDLNPEGSSARQTVTALSAHRQMAVTANPLATQAAMAMLEQGGSAADAVIAAQMVLNLVEPQSSGIGGGGFILSYTPAAGLQAYDGREQAPDASPDHYFQPEGQVLSFTQAVNSGLSVGVPGLLRALEALHQEQGKLAWATLFQPAIDLAETGFAVSPRLHTLLVQSRHELAQNPGAAHYFLDQQAQPWPVGHRLRNPQFAQTLRQLAEQGADFFYQGPLAQAMVQAVRQDPLPGYLGVSDLAAYRSIKRSPVCMTVMRWELCGMPPPSSGPIAVMQIVGMLQHTPIAQFAADSWQAIHYFSEASRLAFADRDAWVADPEFAAVPVSLLLNADYLEQRAALIKADQAMPQAQAGQFPDWPQPQSAQAMELPSTTHLVVADEQGGVISMTSSIESAFGSKLWVHGFLLNNQLTDFSLLEKDAQGHDLLNRLEAGKRPRSSMAPMLVLEQGRPKMALGSPGGSAIVLYVAQALTAMMYWDMSAQEAVSLDHVGKRGPWLEIEQGTAAEHWIKDLQALGHQVRTQPFPSGTHVIYWDQQGVLQAGVDPRREGMAAGE